MIERKGDMFTTKAHILGHGVNVDGLMGAGIAKTFAAKFPKNLAGYKARCADKTLVPGGAYLNAQDHPTTIVANFASQARPGRDARYNWLFNSLYSGVQNLDVRKGAGFTEKYGSVIAVPEIGCGIGGLEWPVAEKIFLAIESIYPDFEFEVWHYV